MKILFAIFQTKNLSNGGVQSITNVIENLNADCHIVTQRETSRNESWRQSGYQVNLIKVKTQGFYKVISLIKSNIWAYRYLKSHTIDIVHGNDIDAYLHMAIGARLAGVKLLLNIRDIKPNGQIYGFKWKVASKLAHHIIVLSKYMMLEITKRLKYSANKISYIYSIVDIESRSSKEKNILEKGYFHIGYVAAFMAKKQQYDFINNGMSLLISRVPNCKIHFIGDVNNEYGIRCKELVTKLKLTQYVEFHGFQTNVASWYSKLDLTVLASQREGLARCMIESISYGTPVVSFDVSSAKEILEDQSCGYVVKGGDYFNLSESIKELYVDDSLRHHMSKNGVTVGRKLFYKENVKNEYTRTYKALIDA